MKRHVIRLLIAVNLMLALTLAYFWVDQSGQWRNIHWLPPAPVKADLGSLPVSLQQPADTDTSHFVAIGDRPLFSWPYDTARLDGHGDLLPLLAFLDADSCIGLGGNGSQLTLQLSVGLEASGIQVAVGERRFDRATRLGFVPAIAEPA